MKEVELTPMDKSQKLVTGVLWGVLVVAMLGVVAGGLWPRLRQEPSVATVRTQPDAEDAGDGTTMPVLFDAPAFALTDQDGKPFASEALRGKPWVASFIFTHCPGVCPKMTMKMATLQKTVPNPDVRLVSFTVDPARDTPEVLKTYATNFGADPARWRFLTGEKAALFDAAAGMKVTAIPAGEMGSPEIVHSEKFLLVDKAGRVRGAYDSGDDASLKKLAADAAVLASVQ